MEKQAPSKDEVLLKNALTLLQKGKYEMTGEEALAFRQVFEYLLQKLKACQMPLVVTKSEEPIKEEIKSKKKK